METPNPHPPFAQAVRADLPAMMPRLVAYAARRLRRAGWVDGRDCAPRASDAEDIVQKAILSGLTGKRVWPEGMSLERFLLGAIKSVAYHEVEAQLRRHEDRIADGEDKPDPASERGVGMDRRRLIAAIERALQGRDPEVEALFAAYVDAKGDFTRAEIAATLGWTPERVSRVRERMNGLLARMGYESDDDDEGLRKIRPRGAAPPPRRRAR